MTPPPMDPGSLLIHRALETAAALHRLVDALKDVDQPTQPPEPPPPGEWRNDRAPKLGDTCPRELVRIWDGEPRLALIEYATAWWNFDPPNRYWAPGHQPTSPPPGAVADQEAEPGAPPDPDKSRTGGWIVDRVPTAEDGDSDREVWKYVHPGTPWSRTGNRPAPTSPPLEPPTGKWIVGPLPTEADANFENDVKVPNVLDRTCPYEWAKYYVVQPGAPWCSPDDNPGPWDPTTLDHDGWIRSRLPTKEDAGPGRGLVFIPGNGSEQSWQHYTFVTPGQPWAP